MPHREPPISAILEALGFVIFLRDETGALLLAGEPPVWLRRLWPAVDAPDATLPVADSPFLENFLVDAVECWREGTGRRCQSGPWRERDTQGAEIGLGASALSVGGHDILLVERMGAAFEEKTAILQSARETVITLQRLNAEVQKKDILLHCVSEEMNAALGNIITALRLLELEQDPGRTRQILGLAARATEEQQGLINKVIDLFAEELENIYGRAGAARAEADFQAVADCVLDMVEPQFREKGVRLEMPGKLSGGARIPAHPEHLERVLTNLLENALQHTPPGCEVAVRLVDEDESVLLRVEDSGPELPPDVIRTLFDRFALSTARSTPTLLRLHFCRIAVANCRGEIGHMRREAGGNCFWIRLPKIPPPK
jgi:signal transduction histidine kinase